MSVKMKQLTDWEKVVALIEEANTVANLIDIEEADFSGHRIAVWFGEIKHMLKEMTEEVGIQ